MNKKPTIAIVSLTCCEGCQVAILDLGEQLLELTEKVKIGDFALIEELADVDYYDVVFVEGTPITSENIQRLKKMRAKSKILVTIGACSCLGGIAELKNYQDKDQRLRYVYKNVEGIENPDIKPVKAYIKVDLEIPGCPINKEEFLQVTKNILAVLNSTPLSGVQAALSAAKIPQRPVCYECQLKKNECLLQKDLPCLGPVILGGCGAPCPSSNYPCDGCRGPLKGINLNNFNKSLRELYGYNQREIDLIMQRFGMLDDAYPEPPTLIDETGFEIMEKK